MRQAASSSNGFLLRAAVATPERRGGPIGRGQKLFEDISSLPRRQQEKVFEFVQAFVNQNKRKAR